MSTPESVHIRVLVVDDHPITRRGIAFGLSVFEDIQVVGEATSGEEAIERYELLCPDVVLMDINLPGMDGITATQRLHQRYAGLRVLILTHYAEPATIRAALQAGASGYLVKDVTLDELGGAIQTTCAGQTVLSRSAAQALLQAPPERREFAGVLTERERQVLALVAAGKSNDEIGRELVISLSTARTHVSTIMSKLGAANRAEAAAVGQHYHLFAEAGEHPNQAGRRGAGMRGDAASQRQSAPARLRMAHASAL